MKRILSVALVALTFTLSSFISKSDNIPQFEKFGFYVGGPTENPPVSLKINADQTYHFYNNSNVKKPIKVTGTWVQDGNRILLQGNESIKFHHIWKIDPDCTCLKSKKGMTFYRLCQD